MQLSQNVWKDTELINTLKNGKVAIMPTDTIYGIVGRAEDISTVNRIYNLKKRASDKPCIILIGKIDELKKFSIFLSEEIEKILNQYWPGPVSIVLNCREESFSYLYRGTKTLAFRLPQIPELRDLLLQTGPLVAPSANPEGLSPAQNIDEAKKYFGDSVDLYADGGENTRKHSKLIKLNEKNEIIVLRE